jgi:uncharacterized RDD family membrane protein YckC
MKCPKCGYLGFETTDRCRNCQYDFSLAPFLPEQELPLHGADRKNESPNDFELPPIARQGDGLNPTPLDLDRLFGESTVASSAPPTPVDRQPAPPPMKVKAEERATDPPPMMAVGGESSEADEVAARSDAIAFDEGALPFDDGPIMAPPAARTPLAVRRSTPEVARNRARGTRPNRPEPLDFELSLPKSDIASRAAIETVASLMEAPSLGARIGAGVIDLLLLAGIDAAILYLTLRITGLQATLEDVRVLPVIPFIGFLVVLGYGYLAAFTVAGGQTIGKMILSLRVIGDDGRPVDAGGGMLRALACLLIPITLGLSYLPAIFTSDHRALHDRLAGTRVVQE